MNNRGLSSSFQITISARLYILALAFTSLLFLSGCEIKSDQLQELERAVSIIQLTTGREVSRSIQDKKAGFTGPIYAQLRIEYEPINHYTKEEVYNEMLDIFEENKWEVKECDACRTASFSASWQQDNYPIPINARVLIRSDENLVSIRIVHSKP